MIIDFHTHTFPAKISRRVVDHLASVSRTVHFTNGSMDDLKESMSAAGIDYSLNLPVMTSPDKVEKINSSLINDLEALKADGILTFGGIHPDYPAYREEIRRLKDAGIRGIKLHPPYQKMDLDDPRMLRVIDAASEAGLAVIIHAGWDIGLYDHDYASVKMILKVLKEVQPETFIAAHFGGWLNWADVERDLVGAPIFLDTAFTLGPLTPNPDSTEPPFSMNNLGEEDFLRIARKHGTDRILFATDSPWMDQSSYVKMFREMPLTDTEREQILHANAEKLLGL